MANVTRWLQRRIPGLATPSPQPPDTRALPPDEAPMRNVRPGSVVPATLALALCALTLTLATSCDDPGGSPLAVLASGVYRWCDPDDACPKQRGGLLSCRDGAGGQVCVETASCPGGDVTCACLGAALCGDLPCHERGPGTLVCAAPDAPRCPGHGWGERWPTGDGCNECTCGVTGVSCTHRDCPAGCDAFLADYEARLASAAPCAGDTDCQHLTVSCQMRDVCDVWVNRTVTAAELDALDDAWAEACSGDVGHSCCDGFAPPPEAVCLEGRCAPADPGPCPASAPGRAVWLDGCRVCECVDGDVACETHGCIGSCEAVRALWAAVLPELQACETVADCVLRPGPAWETGLAECELPLARDAHGYAWSQLVQRRWFELGCRHDPLPCPDRRDPLCLGGRCVLPPAR